MLCVTIMSNWLSVFVIKVVAPSIRYRRHFDNFKPVLEIHLNEESDALL
jgi:hypothetical protein